MTSPNSSGFVLVRDDIDAPIYFLRLGLGIFWECGSHVEEARVFPTRLSASRYLRAHGKHRQGWRVLPKRLIGGRP